MTLPVSLRLLTKCPKNLFVRNMSLLSKKAFVNGEWVSGSDNKMFEVKNPATGEVIGSVPDMNVADTQHAIDAAAEAFVCWGETSGKERGILLRKWYELMVQHGDEIAKIMTSESGKALVESKGEVAYGNSFVDWYAEEARRINGEVIDSPNKARQILVTRQPIGVVGLITPWNFPHAMITRKAAAALAAGCTCVIRPAEDTPLTALALASLSDKAGFPKGVLNFVTSNRPNAGPIGKLLCESPLVAGISFTGSTEVGKLLYRQCGNGIKRIGLELGGNAPFIVFPTANLDHAVTGAIASKFRNCGQTCVSANRFIIHESIYDEFVEKLAESVKKNIVIGDGAKTGVSMGPLINEAQVNKVNNIVRDAVDKGAHVVIGGKKAEDVGKFFFQPTILTNITVDMRIYYEEVFGPVAPIFRFSTEEEAMCIANDTQRGLAGYFYSSDISQCFRVARRLEVGMVGINEGLISTAEAPFGGVKESGIGREGSRHGVDEYTYIKYNCFGNLC